MHIKQFHVENEFSCLKNFDIEFKIVEGNGGSSTILIGENGAGKSTMLKAIKNLILIINLLLNIFMLNKELK